jgi:hypothetical protein
MRARNQRACVVLAWTIRPAGLASAGHGSSAHPVQVSTRTVSLNRLTVSAAGPAQVHESGRPRSANSALEAFVMPVSPRPARINPSQIVIADHDRLIVTRDKGDDTICVLRPPGADPADILRVARLVLPEGPYGKLAERLGVSPNWPADQ